MILYLRDKKNNTIVDIELYTTNGYVELHSAVMIKPYSEFLLNNLDEKDKIIEIFSYIDELRGWMWEVYFMTKKNTNSEYNNVLKNVREFLIGVAKEFNLNYVED